WRVPDSVQEYRLKYAEKPIVDWLGFDQTTRQFNLDPANHTLFAAANNIDAVVPLGIPGNTQTYNLSLPANTVWNFALRYRAPAVISNRLPIVNAGVDISVQTSTASLSATVSDDGLPNPPAHVATNWSKVSGPGIVNFANPSALATSASFLVNGTYVLRITANDGTLDTFDEIKVVVDAQNTDTTAPTPNPMTWAATPSAQGVNAISMMATTAVDDSGVVEYYFSCISGGQGCVDSGWQASPSYIAGSLAAGGNYSFQIIARDGSQNTTAASTIESATTDSDTIPDTPSNFSATAISETQIDLSWDDNANNEDNMIIDRSLDGVNDWSQIASLNPDTISYSDTGLDHSTTYYYRLKAVNSNGNSTDVTTNATTDTPPPAFIDYVAIGETAFSGTISGNYLATHDDDGSIQRITERDSGGKRRNRHDFLEHRWTFNINAGAVISLFANAWITNGSEDNFDFEFSTNDSSYLPAFTVSSNSSSNTQGAILTDGISGTVYVRVKDTDRAQGNRNHQTINIDQIYIRSENAGSGTAPDAPTNLAAVAVSSNQINISWQDNSDNESSFKIERSLDGSSWLEVATVVLNASNFSDSGLSSETTYHYRVKAFNDTGASTYTNSDSATTAAVQIDLSANGFTERRRHNVDLTWSGVTSSSVDIWRDTNIIATLNNVSGNNSYRDNIGARGGATYVYKVCQAGSTECSDDVTVIF
nr:fibronectin type III domain-containing protein [Gammaproteobacteria bacterium]